MDHKIPIRRQCRHVTILQDYRIFERPIFRSSDFVAHVRIPDPTAKRILVVLRGEGILKTLAEGRGRRAAVLAFRALLNIAEGYDAF